MENLVIVSKTKKFIKDRAGLNTSAAFFEVASKKIETLCKNAIAHAQQDGRKTVMGRDFGADDALKVEEVLVVASKVKKLIKEQAGLNTSSQVIDALTQQVQLFCDEAAQKAKGDGRKTVMDRDLTA